MLYVAINNLEPDRRGAEMIVGLAGAAILAHLTP
jgi:hypothetical protein